MCLYSIENCLMFLNYFNVNFVVDFGYLLSRELSRAVSENKKLYIVES